MAGFAAHPPDPTPCPPCPPSSSRATATSDRSRCAGSFRDSPLARWGRSSSSTTWGRSPRFPTPGEGCRRHHVRTWRGRDGHVAVGGRADAPRQPGQRRGRSRRERSSDWMTAGRGIVHPVRSDFRRRPRRAASGCTACSPGSRCRDNSYGQLGRGRRLRRRAAVTVVGDDAGATVVAGGAGHTCALDPGSRHAHVLGRHSRRRARRDSRLDEDAASRGRRRRSRERRSIAVATHLRGDRRRRVRLGERKARSGTDRRPMRTSPVTASASPARRRSTRSATARASPTARRGAGATTSRGRRRHDDASRADQRAMLANATTIANGGNHTCALRADTTVACWGQLRRPARDRRDRRLRDAPADRQGRARSRGRPVADAARLPRAGRRQTSTPARRGTNVGGESLGGLDRAPGRVRRHQAVAARRRDARPRDACTVRPRPRSAHAAAASRSRATGR